MTPVHHLSTESFHFTIAKHFTILRFENQELGDCSLVQRCCESKLWKSRSGVECPAFVISASKTGIAFYCTVLKSGLFCSNVPNGKRTSVIINTEAFFQCQLYPETLHSQIWKIKRTQSDGIVIHFRLHNLTSKWSKKKLRFIFGDSFWFTFSLLLNLFSSGSQLNWSWRCLKLIASLWLLPLVNEKRRGAQWPYKPD